MKGQKRSSDILTKQSKPSLAKSSTKLFFVSRLRGKKYKTSGSSKVLQDASNTLDTSQGAAQVPQKVPQINASFLSRAAAFISPHCFCVVRQRLSPDALGDEGFFDLLSRFQSNRMDDQRCSVQKKGSRLSLNTGQESPPRVIRKCKRAHAHGHPGNQKPLPLTDVASLSLSAAVSESANVSGGQGRRVEETSAAGGSLPGLRLHQNSSQAVLNHLMANADSAEPDDDFFDMLVKCQVTEKPSVLAKGTMKTSLFENPKSRL